MNFFLSKLNLTFITVLLRNAAVVELVDTLDLGSSAFGVGVQVPPAAPLNSLFYRELFFVL
jgi:hypothetical protein